VFIAQIDFLEGVEYIDTVTLGELVIHGQSIGIATSVGG